MVRAILEPDGAFRNRNESYRNENYELSLGYAATISQQPKWVPGGRGISQLERRCAYSRVNGRVHERQTDTPASDFSWLNSWCSQVDK
jgi:hypothetical protein